MKYSEAATLANNLRELADFIDENGVKLPAYGSHTFELRYYLTETDYTDTGDVDANGNAVWKSIVNEAKTKEVTRDFVLALGSCDKEYDNSRLNITKTFGKNVRIFGMVNRELTCKRKVVGTKVVPALNLPERVEEIVEWDCDEAPSLLALVK